MNTSKKIMSFIGLFILIGFVILMIAKSVGPEKRLEFEPLDGQIALLHKAYDKWFGERVDILAMEPGRLVLCDWVKYRGSVALEAEDVEEWAEKFSADMMDLVISKKMAANYWAGRTAFEEWWAVFNGDENKRSAIVERCKDVDPAIDEAIRADIDAFKAFAAAENLLDENGRLREDRRDILHLIYRHLWISLSSRQVIRDNIEPPEERIAFLRWQIEQSAMPLDRKIQKLDEYSLQKTDSYDFMFALAVLYAQNGMAAEACSVLHEALSGSENAGVGNAFRIQRYSEALETLRQAHPAACH